MSDIKKIISFTKSNAWIREKLNSGGWGNGYCALPKDHPCFGMHYNTIYEKYPNISFPHELTFSRLNESKNGGQFSRVRGTKDLWIVGFDTMHYGDDLKTWSRKKVTEGAAKLAFAFYEIWILEEKNKKNGNVNSEKGCPKESGSSE